MLSDAQQDLHPTDAGSHRVYVLRVEVREPTLQQVPTMCTSTARMTHLLQAMVLVSLSAVTARAQESYPQRTLGAPIAVGAEPLRDIAAVRELSDGRLLVAERGPMNAMIKSMMASFARAAGSGGRGSTVDSIANQPESPPARIVLLETKLASVQAISRQAGADASELQQPQALVSETADTTLLLVIGRSDLLVIDPSGK